MPHARPLAFVFVALCVATGAPAQSDGDLAKKIDAVFARWDKPDRPGCAVGVIRDGKWLHRRGYGQASLEHAVPNGPRTVFYIGSTSKQFVAASVLLAANQGHLSLDDDVRKHIPELPDYGTPVTIRHMIHHTSGLRDYLNLMALAGMPFENVYSDDDIIRLIARQKDLNFKPGDRHLYSNSGYFLLAEVVKRATGKSLRRFARRNIFGPLGMSRTHFHDNRLMVVKNRAAAYSPFIGGYRLNWLLNFDKVGSGGLLTCVDDLLAWDRNFYTNKLSVKDLPARMLERGKLNDGTVLSYALGLVHGTYKGLATVAHGGAFMGFRAQLLRFPGEKLSVIVLCNLATMNPTGLARRVADVCLGDRLQPEAKTPGGKPAEKPKKAPSPRVDVEPYAGTYYCVELDVAYRMKAASGRLIVEGLRHDGTVFRRGSLRPTAKDRFSSPGLEFRFERNNKEGVTGFVLDAGRALGIRFERRR